MTRLLLPALASSFLVFACTGQVSSSSGASECPAASAISTATESCTLSSGALGQRTCAQTPSGAEWSCNPLSCSGTFVDCVMADGSAGAAQCSNGTAGRCWSTSQCSPDAPPAGSCFLGPNGWTLSSASGSGTPLVLSFDNAPVAFTEAAGEFDVMGRGASYGTAWVSAATPWLAVDLDGNGRIDDGAELFGSMSVLPSGARARDGFEALAAYDDDGDGSITGKDAVFARLLVWRDRDQDRRSSPREVTTAAEAGLVAIRLDARDVPRCTGDACEIERAGFTFVGDDRVTREGAVVDVHFGAR